MKSQVLNFLWLNLEHPAPPDPEDGSIRVPMPENYIDNVRKAGARHPAAEIDLWVDSERLTQKQMDYLKVSVENGLANVHLKDLRAIPEYAGEDLYNKAETNAEWRSGSKDTVIWCQVDAAKILISLQGDFDQMFFADLDRAHVDIGSRRVQGMLKKHGLLIGSGQATHMLMENQLWGFTRPRRAFFEKCYATALECAKDNENGWMDFLANVKTELVEKEAIPRAEICLLIAADGSQARQPGSDSSFIPAEQIASIFNQKSENDSAAICSASQRKTGPGKSLRGLLQRRPAH